MRKKKREIFKKGNANKSIEFPIYYYIIFWRPTAANIHDRVKKIRSQVYHRSIIWIYMLINTKSLIITIPK